MFFGTRVPNYWVLEPSGGSIDLLGAAPKQVVLIDLEPWGFENKLLEVTKVHAAALPALMRNGPPWLEFEGLIHCAALHTAYL